SASATSPTTSPDPCSRPAASDPDYTLDCEEPPNQWEYLGQSWCNITGRSSSCNAQDPTSPYWSLPVSPRHGSVLPITLEEWEGLMEGFNSPVHVEASLVKDDGTAVDEEEWLNEVPELKVDWTDFNGTDLAPAWLR